MSVNSETIKIFVVPINKVVIDEKSRDWCKLPYPNHPRGCPNYGKRPICPPQAPLFEDVISQVHTLVGVRFNLEEWANHLKSKHPSWTDRQARCCLYWQGKVRKVLREKCEKLAKSNDLITYIPEAMGVHVFDTCATIGIMLEKNPKKYVWKIAIIGTKQSLFSKT